MRKNGSTEVRRLVVTGRVQGVGYRYFALRRARSLGLTGWVRNLADGSVEVRAAGRPEELGALCEALREGPPGARVRDVRSEALAEQPEWTAFEIRP